MHKDPGDAGSVDAYCQQARPFLKVTGNYASIGSLGNESPHQKVGRALELVDEILALR
jgi:hypothetical protein